MAKRVVQPKNPKKQFLGVLVVIAVVGIAVIGYLLSGSAAKAITVDPTIPAGAAEGYLLGREDAPVQAMEFGDFECGACGEFAVVTEPDIRARLVNTGLVAFRFFDFPLEQHRNTWAAHLAASCAEDEKKFWGMHDRLYGGQHEWNGEVTNNPMRVFRRYASELGLDVGKWEACVTAQTHAGRIKGNQAEGTRRNIGQTPTFIVGSRQVPGNMGYDDFKALVDSALATAAADSAKGGAKRAGVKKSASQEEP
ncbi:MAG TPA: thioredoxin domain-containing protein [Gemmatimonadaceae bacterium]|nr:thioredoxin domain-containing protein [Gemmatimonadaceae bacterium]